MKWIQYLLTGLVIGAIARFVLPGADRMGLVATMLIGIGGSLLGGFAGHAMGKPAPEARFHPAGFWLSLLGAVVLLLVWRLLRHA